MRRTGHVSVVRARALARDWPATPRARPLAAATRAARSPAEALGGRGGARGALAAAADARLRGGPVQFSLLLGGAELGKGVAPERGQGLRGAAAAAGALLRGGACAGLHAQLLLCGALKVVTKRAAR